MLSRQNVLRKKVVMLFWLFGLWTFRGHLKYTVKQTQMIGLLPFVNVWKVSDLPAAALDAVYRQTCHINFRTNKAIPVYFQQEHLKKSKTSSGRPRDADAGDA